MSTRYANKISQEEMQMYTEHQKVYRLAELHVKTDSVHHSASTEVLKRLYKCL